MIHYYVIGLVFEQLSSQTGSLFTAIFDLSGDFNVTPATAALFKRLVCGGHCQVTLQSFGNIPLMLREDNLHLLKYY